MSEKPQKYSIFDNGRRLPSGGPLKHEFYNPAWTIQVGEGEQSGDVLIAIFDPGDGSAEPLARKILAFLNSGTSG